MSRFLYIEEGEATSLPQKYQKINNICAIIYDQLTEICKESNYADLKTTKFTLEHQELAKSFISRKINPLEWLNQNGFNKELESVVAKEITNALIVDFLNFIFESIHCAKRGKMTVAYALIRKPLIDELLIFEQLLINKSDFVNRFYHSGCIDDYDPSKKTNNKKQIIEEAINKLRLNLFPSPEFIFDLRYNKEIGGSINSYSNKSLHIVTKDKNYRTLAGELNFVFSSKEDINIYYEHYFTIVPYLLIYSVSIIDELVFELILNEENKPLKTIKEFRRLIGLILLNELAGVSSKSKNDKLFDEISKELKLSCNYCSKINIIERADCELFFEKETLICTHCFESILNNTTIRIIEEMIIGKTKMT